MQNRKVFVKGGVEKYQNFSTFIGIGIKRQHYLVDKVSDELKFDKIVLFYLKTNENRVQN
jgi:hypothetical protein